MDLLTINRINAVFSAQCKDFPYLNNFVSKTL